MSDAIFPTLPGLAWDVTKTPVWHTQIQTAVSGKELRAAFMAYPLWQFTLTYSVLRADTVNAELQSLMGFFLARQGMYDSFLYFDPTDNAVTAQRIAQADGVTRQYQLLREVMSTGGFTEPVVAPVGAPLLYLNNVQTTAFTLQANGVVSFNTAPPSGVSITWTGNFYYRVRFLADSLDFVNFMQNLWSLKTVKFQSVKV